MTNLQLELIKLFNYELPPEQLFEIKQLLAQYFAEKTTSEMESLWELKEFAETTLESWLHQHQRAPYH